MSKKIAAPAPSRKAEIERLAAEQAADARGRDVAPGRVRDMVRKRESDREREKYRPPRERPPRGYKYTDDGSVEHQDAPQIPVHIEGTRGDDGTIDELHSIEIDVGPDFWAEVTDADRWMIGHLAGLLDEARGDRLEVNDDRTTRRVPGSRAPRYRLEQLRKAYEAAFRWPPEVEWQRILRRSVEHALHDRQGKRRRARSKRWPGTDGTTIALQIRMGSPRGTVPAGLTGAEIEELLHTATLARGGGSGKAKRTINWETAVDRLIAKLGAEPYQPPE